MRRRWSDLINNIFPIFALIAKIFSTVEPTLYALIAEQNNMPPPVKRKLECRKEEKAETPEDGKKMKNDEKETTNPKVLETDEEEIKGVKTDEEKAVELETDEEETDEKETKDQNCEICKQEIIIIGKGKFNIKTLIFSNFNNMI